MAAELTAPPSFTASEIAPGDPLALAIPVNEYTQSVETRIRFVDDTDPGAGSGWSLRAETVGDEVVQLPLEDTDLAPGVYFADYIALAGDNAGNDTFYWNSDVTMPYVLNVVLGGDGGPSCRSDIPIPTFEVVGD